MNRKQLFALLGLLVLAIVCALTAHRLPRLVDTRLVGETNCFGEVVFLKATAGDARAQFWLGLQYANGAFGRKKDLAEAKRWFEKAADQGCVSAQAALGDQYRDQYWDEFAGVSGKNHPNKQTAAEVIKWYSKAADSGNIDAQVSLGCFRFYRAFFDLQYLEWVKEKGTNIDHARLSFEPTEVSKDCVEIQEGLRWLRKAAELGSKEAQIEIVRILECQGYEKDAEYRRWTQAAADQGDLEAQYRLAILIEINFGDPIRAVQWYVKSAEQGFLPAMYALSRMYRSGLGVPLDERIATEWLRKIAHASRSVKSELVRVNDYRNLRQVEHSENPDNMDVISTAFHQLGGAFHQGRGVSTDIVEAYKWYNLAASRGYVSGEQDRDLLASQMTAQQIVQGQERASAWLNPKISLPELNISRQGSVATPKSLPPSGTNCAPAISLEDSAPKPQEDLGNKPTPEEEAESHEVVGLRNYADRQYATALEPLRHAAMMGRARAQYYLGRMYSAGQGVQQSYPESAKWYAKAVRRGYLPAFSRFANQYMYGSGVKKNLSEAVRLSHIAAELGNADAQFQLGQCYQFGEGVKDELEAEKWYRRAAEQGKSDAYSQLMNMYLGRDEALLNLFSLRNASKSDSDWAIKELSRSKSFKNLRIEAYKWAILSVKQGEKDCQLYEWITDTNSWAYESQKAEFAEAFHRFAAFVARKENTNEWLTGDAPRSGGEASSTGTGFFISEDGYLLTNFHVVDDAMSIVIQCGGNTYPARLVKVDPINDLALLKLAGKFRAIPLAPSRTAKMGDSVFTVGFPNPQLQGVAPKLTDGKISSLSGMQDDSRHFQISVAVQPGNSGGALVNSVGNIVGIVTARLSDKAALESSGALPQNVNYAVKSSFILAFLESVPELSGKLNGPWPAKQRKFEDVVKEAQDAAALVLVY